MKNKILISLFVLIFVSLLTNLASARSIVSNTQGETCLWTKTNIHGTDYYHLKDMGWNSFSVRSDGQLYINKEGQAININSYSNQGQPYTAMMVGSNYDGVSIVSKHNGIAITSEDIGLDVWAPNYGLKIRKFAGDNLTGISVVDAKSGIDMTVWESGITTHLLSDNSVGYLVYSPFNAQSSVGYFVQNSSTGLRTVFTKVAADLQGEVILRDNAGQGNAYACFDANGKLFRSLIPCTASTELSQ